MSDSQSAWHGVTIHDQATADERIPGLLATPAAVRFVVGRGLTGPVDLTFLKHGTFADGWLDCLRGTCGTRSSWADLKDRRISWVIVEGGDQPLHPDWIRAIRDSCVAAGVPFCFRGWGEYVPTGQQPPEMFFGLSRYEIYLQPSGSTVHRWTPGESTEMNRVGSANSGRLLDGKLWDEWPQLHGSEAPDE